MNSRGQAALEYLMTYGWALVIIVVVAGILFLLVSSPSGGVNCSSSDVKMSVQAANIPKVGAANIKVLNGTGGIITITAVAPSTVGITAVTPTPAVGGTVNGGSVLDLVPTGTFTAALDSNASVTVQYTDQFAYVKVVKISCQGTPQ